jgi:hypothetical protein
MIESDVCTGLDLELQQRAALLCRIVRSAPKYIDGLCWWLGFSLSRVPRVPDIERELDEREAMLLDAPPGTTVLHREGYLVSTLGGTLLRVAQVNALVRVLKQAAALHQGTVPLSTLVPDVARHTHFAYQVDGPPVDDLPALHSQATLLRAGRPVALMYERVLWKALTHRAHAPADLPGYVQSPIRIGVTS